ncbi:hypothetical protein K9L97_03805 [Candidatus Woesearchaeota archaeon]|nr:hypothetical protein [Candidatus Woesearchaeota archaeon]
MKKAQSSMELILIFSVSMIIIVPTIYIFINQVYGSEAQIISNQLNKIGNEMRTTAKELYVLGSDSWLTLEFELPTEIKEVRLDGNEDAIVFTYQTKAGTSSSVIYFENLDIIAGPNETEICTERCILNLTPGKNELKMKATTNLQIRLETTIVSQVETECGNGFIEGTEECDNAGNNGQTCSASYDETCTYCDNSCKEQTVSGPYCGDIIINGPEQCDTYKFITSCESKGFKGGILSCENECLDVTTDNCYNAENQEADFTTEGQLTTYTDITFKDDSTYPGTALIQYWYKNGRQIKYESLGPKDFTHQFQDPGTYEIRYLIQFQNGHQSDDKIKQITINTKCGNDVAEQTELCDNEDLKGETCTTLGFTGGILSCTDICELDLTGCTGNPS